jgi:hypothetical protein
MARADVDDEAFSGDSVSGDSDPSDADASDADASDADASDADASDADASDADASDADASDADAASDASSWGEADDAEPVSVQLDIEDEDDRSQLVTLGGGAQRHALRLTLAQRTSGSEFLVLDVAFQPPLHVPGLTDQSLVHFSAFQECVQIVSGLEHQRRVQEGAPRKRRAVRPPGEHRPVPVAVLSECTFKIIRLGPLILEIKTRKHAGALMTATAHVLLDQRLKFAADYSDVPRVLSRADAEHDALQATVPEALSARPGQRYQVAVYCQGEPGCCEDARSQSARKIARGRWQPDLPTELNFLRMAVHVYKQVNAQDRLVAARA